MITSSAINRREAMTIIASGVAGLTVDFPSSKQSHRRPVWIAPASPMWHALCESDPYVPGSPHIQMWFAGGKWIIRKVHGSWWGDPLFVKGDLDTAKIRAERFWYEVDVGSRRR